MASKVVIGRFINIFTAGSTNAKSMVFSNHFSYYKLKFVAACMSKQAALARPMRTNVGVKFKTSKFRQRIKGKLIKASALKKSIPFLKCENT